MTSDRDQLAELIHDAVYSGAQRVNWEDIADAILAAGWRSPKPPCKHRMIRVEADDATEAELIACQMTAAHTGWTPVRSVIIEWEEP